MNYFDIKSKILKAYYKFLTQFFYRFMFRKIGGNSKIIRPLLMKNTKYINIASNVTINERIFMVVERFGFNDNPALIIEDGTTIGHFNHIVCCDEVHIGKNVLTADKVYISDNCHQYKDVSLPISFQGIYSNGKVEIGDETWIGENVCIISASIGKHCVIGANSVVTHNVPDYCVVVGSPAKIIKRYDVEKGTWVKTYE